MIDLIMPDSSFHSARMGLSLDDKARLLPFLLPGPTIELGCAAGQLLNLISTRVPSARLVGVDIDDGFLTEARDRYPTITFLSRDISKWQVESPHYRAYANVVLSSTLHEIPDEALSDVLTTAATLLFPKGRLLLRDGVKPYPALVRVLLKTQYAERKFLRFVEEYRNRPVPYDQHTDPATGRPIISLSAYDLHDILCKYWYEGALWSYDMNESYGRWTEDGYVVLVKTAGFIVLSRESYIARYQYAHWVEDFAMLDGAQFPNSHVFVVGERVP